MVLCLESIPPPCRKVAQQVTPAARRHAAHVRHHRSGSCTGIVPPPDQLADKDPASVTDGQVKEPHRILVIAAGHGSVQQPPFIPAVDSPGHLEATLRYGRSVLL